MTPADAAAWLDKLGISGDADIEETTQDERARIVSAWVRAHLAQGLPAPPAESLVFLADHDAKTGLALRSLFRMADACGREGAHDVGIAWLMGDAAAEEEAKACFARYRTAITEGVHALRDGGVERMQAVQVARTSQPAYSGMVAGIGMTHVLADRERPCCIVAPRSDGKLQVSTRGLDGHVARGLDLGKAVAEAAHAIGHEGGGHPVAAGTVIPGSAEAAFLEALDAALMRQGFLPKA